MAERAVGAPVEACAEAELDGRDEDPQHQHAARQSGDQIDLERLAQPRVRQHLLHNLAMGRADAWSVDREGARPRLGPVLLV